MNGRHVEDIDQIKIFESCALYMVQYNIKSGRMARVTNVMLLQISHRPILHASGAIRCIKQGNNQQVVSDLHPMKGGGRGLQRTSKYDMVSCKGIPIEKPCYHRGFYLGQGQALPHCLLCPCWLCYFSARRGACQKLLETTFITYNLTVVCLASIMKLTCCQVITCTSPSLRCKLL